MAQSPEYPDLRWMPPKSWTDANRTSVQVIVIHTTEGSAHGQSAEDGASYDQRRTDGTSTHYFVDSDSTIQCVRTADQAHTARAQGNRRGIQYELCGRTTLDWSGSYAQAMLRRAAKQAARDAEKWGIPVRKVSPAQVADGMKGFCGHVDITAAFPQDNGTHTDPGARFPWSQFLDLVRAELEPEDDMLIKKGESGEEVKFWQYVLGDLGYNPGTVDGVYGPQTEAAINKYRADTVKAGPITYLSGWQAFNMLRTMMDRRAGKPGKDGHDGTDGVDGKDGVLTGTLDVTGGQLTVKATGANE